MNREKLIARLKKLFALGQSSNQHEAEAAMQKANELMTEYQISMSEVDLAEEGEIIREDVVLDHGKRQTWIQILAHASAHLYGATASYQTLRLDKGLRLNFYGTKADVVAAQFTFKHLYHSWRSIVGFDIKKNRPLNTKSFKQSHGVGFSIAIRNRVDALVNERRGVVLSATGRDLVLVKDAALNSYMSKLEISKNSDLKVGYGFDIGIEKGAAIPLNALKKNDGVSTLMLGVAA